MFKKSLVAVAVLGTAAGFACAADVTLYGKADAGLVYTNTKTTSSEDATVKAHQFGLESGVNSASRFGLKGTEDLGNGLKVGFKLENGFNVDDGALGNGGRLFGREASLSVSGDFGTLSAGRMGGVGSGAGTYSLFTGIADAFDGGNVDVFGLVTTERYDNMLTYQTPKFAGVQATFQYSFKGNNKEDKDLQKKGFYDPATGREGSAATDRYASMGLTGDFGALQTVLTYEYLDYASNNGADLRNKDIQNGQILSLGGNYDCGFAKTFIAAQYFKDLAFSEDTITGYIQDTDATKPGNQEYDGVSYGKGYALALGTIVPVAGGDLTTAVYYRDADLEWDAFQGEKDTAKYTGVTVKYEYPLSKRTSVYTGAGFGQEKIESNADSYEAKQKLYQAFVGMTHSF